MRGLASWLGLAVCLLCSTAVASAHPLGNFTINHLAEVTPHAKRLDVRYVLDIAEIPTFQIMRASSPTATWDSAQRDTWAASEVSIVTTGLHIDVDGAPVTLRELNVHARLRPGAAGLPILYWVANFSTALSPGAHRIQVDDGVYADRRIGWKDIIVAPQTEPTQELRHYPTALISSPRQVGSVAFATDAAGTAHHIVDQNGAPPDVIGTNTIMRTNALSDMFSSKNRTPLFVLLTILVAYGLGALHAIEPGHGKALLAFTLVGSRATVKQAAILAASLTFAHTIGVLILGVVLFFAAGFVSETIYPWITLLSGIAVAIIGARNLSRYLRIRAAAHEQHDGHTHAHAEGMPHDHDHGEGGHSHALPGSGPIDFRAAIVAAMSGGVAPCPAAIVVMLAALRLHQLGYGLMLIVIFSMGLASVLTGLGIAVVHGSGWVTRSGKFDRIVAAGPLLSAALISVVGAVMVAQGVAAQGVHASVWTLGGAVILLIGAYAFVPHIHARFVEQPT